MLLLTTILHMETLILHLILLFIITLTGQRYIYIDYY